MQHAEIGIIGLGVMGKMLARNMARHDCRVAGYDLDAEKVAAFSAADPDRMQGYASQGKFLAALQQPRQILLMVPSGRPVDAVLESLRPHLAADDLIIDAGNSFFKATERRAADLHEDGIRYLGTGVSGGAHGALWGPSIMPGGDETAWTQVQPLLEAVAAKVDGDPCVAYLGPRGAGHYVKMVHNGIEYAVMQLLAESYDLLQRGLDLTAPELHETFARWNETELASYLVEITAEIFAAVDEATGRPLIEVIKDAAKQKGTGKWTSQNAMDVGTPTPTIDEAVMARVLSAYKDEREQAANRLPGPAQKIAADKAHMIATLHDALYAAQLLAYTQGFALLHVASGEYDYDLHLNDIARIWRGGCIIRAAALEDIRAVYADQPDLPNLLLHEDFGARIVAGQNALRRVVGLATSRGIPAPAFSAALAYFDGYRSARLPANLIQAQRDYFGAHTYERLDREGAFHTAWRDLEEPPEDAA